MILFSNEKKYSHAKEPDFIKIMDNLNLAYPKKIDVALPWNLDCGADPN